jgi:VanZ family protein
MSSQNRIKSYSYNTAILFWLRDHTSIDLYSIFREDMVDIFVRKLAHLVEYSILSIVVYWVSNKIRLRYTYILTIIFCILIAVFDELFQLFRNQRTASMLDVFIDTIGIIITVGMITLLQKIKLELINRDNSL